MQPPLDAQQIAQWARIRGLRYQAAPEPDWYRAWEPFDTLVAPPRYFNAVEATLGQARAVVAEPWSAVGDSDPIGRALLAFVVHPGFRHRASARAGASHLTRVTFLATKRPREQQTGDVEWDERVVTFAETPLEAVRAFNPSLRRLLLAWSFQGHMELRPGGFLLHLADAQPVAADYERILQWLPKVIEKALKTRG